MLTILSHLAMFLAMAYTSWPPFKILLIMCGPANPVVPVTKNFTIIPLKF
jgi:hypothetical protein